MSLDDDTLLNAIQKKIPSYGAYREQEARRQDDRLTREFLVRRISDAKAALDKAGSQVAAAGDLDAPLLIERLRQRLDHAQSRLAAAVEGYAGWFSERQVDAQLLKQVATLDANLVSLVDQIDTLAQQQVGSENSATGELREALELLHARLDRRHELLRAGS